MHVQRQQVLRSDAARKLDALELVAALLERDVRHTRARMVERGAPAQPLLRPKPRSAQRLRQAVSATGELAGKLGTGVLGLMLHPRLRAGLHQAYAFAADLVLVLGLAAAGVAIIAAAVMFSAPPV